VDGGGLWETGPFFEGLAIRARLPITKNTGNLFSSCWVSFQQLAARTKRWLAISFLAVFGSFLFLLCSWWHKPVIQVQHGVTVNTDGSHNQTCQQVWSQSVLIQHALETLSSNSISKSHTAQCHSKHRQEPQPNLSTSVVSVCVHPVCPRSTVL
jgi:hypothetical protein